MLEHSVFVLFVWILFYLFCFKTPLEEELKKKIKRKERGKTPGN